MRQLLRSLAFPVACAFTGAATALLVVHLSAAPPPAPPPAPACAPAVVQVHAPPSPPLPLVEPPPRPEPLVIPEDAVRCPTPERCTVRRAFLDVLFANPAHLTRQARVMPSIRDGVTRGFKFYGIRPDSLPKRLGLRNGDLLTAVDGAPLVRVEQALAAVQRLRTATTLELDLERKGEPLRLHITLE